MQKKIFTAVLGLAIFAGAIVYNGKQSETKIIENAEALAAPLKVVACTDCENCGPCLIPGGSSSNNWTNHLEEVTIFG